MSKNHDALFRQWNLLRLIPREPRHISTTEARDALVAEGYDISLRTVQRDLLNLSTVFPFTCEEGGGPLAGRWYWPRQATAMDIPSLAPAEALAMVMMREQAQTLLPASTAQLLAPQFERAAQVLSAQSANRLASWKKCIRVLARGPQLALPTIGRDVQYAVYEAVLLGRQLLAKYHGRAKDEARDARLHPYGLVVKDGLIYLVAAAGNYDKPVHYALHRFVSARLLDEPARIPGGFDLDAYLHEQQAFGYPAAAAPIGLVLSVDASIAQHLRERPLSRDQIITALDGGRSRVEATLVDTAELRWWLLGFGGSVEVLQPASLRRELAAELARAAKQYAGT